MRSETLSAKSYADIFTDPEVPDAEWLARVCQESWIALSHDRHILYDPEAQRVIMEGSGRLLVIRGHRPPSDLARMFVAGLTRIERFISKHEAPFIAVVRRVSTHREESVQVQMRLTFEAWSKGKKIEADAD